MAENGLHTGHGFTSAGRGGSSKRTLQLGLEGFVARGGRCSQEDLGMMWRGRCCPGELEGAWGTTPGLGRFSESEVTWSGLAGSGLKAWANVRDT